MLIELCRPVMTPGSFTSPTSVKEMAETLFVTESAVKQHLDRLYDKFGIYADEGRSRRVLLANEAIQRGAVVAKDFQTDI